MELSLGPAFSALPGMVKPVYPLDLSFYDVNSVEHMIDAVDCFPAVHLGLGRFLLQLLDLVGDIATARLGVKIDGEGENNRAE